MESRQHLTKQRCYGSTSSQSGQSYEEEKQEEPAPAENQTPKTGDTKDGMVYVEGFGWITDEGEGRCV